MMTYEEVVHYIESVPKFAKKNGPEHTAELARRLGNPQENMRVIHVAGTNGKGSVCAFLSAMLVAGGKSCGLFTSPHLVRMNERIQIDQRPVTDDEFTRAFEEVMTQIKAMEAEGYAHPAYFELLFAMMLVIFRDRKVEYAIWETGLGGRLDATNVIRHPLVTILTSISLDHTEYLGDTVTEIAGEKAGIIKPGVPVIYDGHCEEAEKVILAKASQMHDQVIGLHKSDYHIMGKTDKTIDFQLNVGYYEHKVFSVPFPADYQAANASLALLAMEVLDPGHKIPLEIRKKALAHTSWQGRMETVLPRVIVDGAHNADGIRQFVKTLADIPKDVTIVLLFSAVSDKDYEKMIQTICNTERLSRVVVTQISGSRVVSADELAGVFRKYTKACVTSCPDVREAFAEALQKKQQGFLFCAGSLYLVGMIKEIIEEKHS